MKFDVTYVLRRLRNELQDIVEPYFWSDEELIDYIDEAQVRFCSDGVPILDSRTEEICRIEYKAGADVVPYHESIRRILSVVRQDSSGGLHSVRLLTQENSLQLFPIRPSDYGVNIDSTRQLNRANDSFDVFTDYDNDYLRLSSPAETPGVLLMQVERLPKDILKECDDILEIRRENIPAILFWASYRAWTKQDSETMDEKAAKRALDMYDIHVGKARIEQKRRTTQPGTMKYGGI
jgi:hypothetical protein